MSHKNGKLLTKIIGIYAKIISKKLRFQNVMNVKNVSNKI